MGASRAALSKSQPQELTTQEKARRSWINEQRGIKDSDTPSQPRMAGGLPGIMGIMSRGAFANRPGWGGPERRSKETRDWIDQQRGVEVQPENKSALRSLFGMRTTADRQRRQDRNSWLDEQIRKSKEEEEKTNAFSPLTQQERRETISGESDQLKDIWDKN